MHRRTTTWAASGVIALGLLLGGCATSPSEEPMTARPEPPPTNTTPGGVPGDVLEQPGFQEAIAAEAQRRGVPPADVHVNNYADVTWPDGSIGCPQPGMMYSQALVPGRLLVLEVRGELASYHTADATFTYCADPTRPVPPEADQTR